MQKPSVTFVNIHLSLTTAIRRSAGYLMQWQRRQLVVEVYGVIWLRVSSRLHCQRPK